MKRALIVNSFRFLKAIAPEYLAKAQSFAAEGSPEGFVRSALWRIAHPNGQLFGDDPPDLDNIFQFLSFAAPRVSQASGQFFQDLWALWETNEKRGGYFVEFGATDGKVLSNTYSLEKRMGWNGVVAEPHPSFAKDLKANRSCFVSTKAVYSESGGMIDFAGLHGRETYSHAVRPGQIVSDPRARMMKVEAISLNDLLIEAKAPPEIDFMSVDTEGSEFAILANFDFDRWRVKCMAAEHNHTNARQKLFDLLTSHGFRRKWPGLGHVDDWYINKSF